MRNISFIIKMKTIYVYLLNEGTDVWRPVEANHLGGDIYVIESEDPDSELEVWEFGSGKKVRCELGELSVGTLLIAVEALD